MRFVVPRWPVFTVLALVSSAACSPLDGGRGPRAGLGYTDDAQRAYETAMSAFRSRDWEEARALFDDVKRRFQYSAFARLAELRIADIAFEQERYIDAISGYREFTQEHRSDVDVEYARYRTTKAMYLDLDDTILLPPLEERDQATTLEANKELRNFLREYPKSRYHEDVAAMQQDVLGRLARHELYVARFYLRTDVPEAAIARCDYALERYPKSGLDAEALVLKGETLLRMKKRDEARTVFQTVLRDYGGPFNATTQNFLDEISRQEAAAKRP
jgi:outer membrane protein assembly factor BamD